MINTDVIGIIENHDIIGLKQWFQDGGDSNLVVGPDDNQMTLIQHVLYEIDEADEETLIKMLQLLIISGADVNKRSVGQFPILTAVIEQKKSIVEILIEADANINVRDELGRTPLTSAVIDNNVEVLEELLKSADTESIDKIGSIWLTTPLGIAFSNLNMKIIELLLIHGANPHLIDIENGCVPISNNIPEDITPNEKGQIQDLIKKYYQPS